MSVFCAIKYPVSIIREGHGERITYITITVVHICSTVTRENNEVTLLILGSFEGIFVYLSYIMISLIKIKPIYPVTLKFLFLPIWRRQ
jgi:uncharacterized membrane protein YobD (UPF0266 family)